MVRDRIGSEWRRLEGSTVVYFSNWRTAFHNQVFYIVIRWYINQTDKLAPQTKTSIVLSGGIIYRPMYILLLVFTINASTALSGDTYRHI